MLALVTAGGHLKEDDPLFIETGIAKKALIPIAGKTMIQWVVDALTGSDHIEGVVIVGLQAGDVNPNGKAIHYVEDQGSIVDNVLAGVDQVKKLVPGPSRVLLSSCDIPLLTTEIVDDFINVCADKPGDIVYTVIEKATMEARFPNSNRTFTALKGGSYSGGDVLMLDTGFMNPNIALFRGATGHRKNFLAQARLIGFTFIFRFLFRLMDLPEAEARSKKALNVSGHVIDYSRPEVAMDIDKEYHYQLVKRELENRQR